MYGCSCFQENLKAFELLTIAVLWHWISVAMVGLIQILFNLSRVVCSRCRSIWTVHLATNLEASGPFLTPLRSRRRLGSSSTNYKMPIRISSPHSLLLHLYSPDPLLHLHFDPSPVLALPGAPCIVVVDNAP